jgi:hypothetical protein
VNKKTRNTLIIAGVVIVGGIVLYRATRKPKITEKKAEPEVSEKSKPEAKQQQTSEKQDSGADGMSYLSKENIEKANQKKRELKSLIKSKTEVLKSLPRKSGFREKSLNLRNEIALLNAQLNLT